MRQAHPSGGDRLLHTAEPYPVTRQFDVRPIRAVIRRTQNADGFSRTRARSTEMPKEAVILQVRGAQAVLRAQAAAAGAKRWGLSAGYQALRVVRCVPEHGHHVAAASGHYEEVPERVAIAEARVGGVEGNPRCVTHPAREEPREP